MTTSKKRSRGGPSFDGKRVLAVKKKVRQAGLLGLQRLKRGSNLAPSRPLPSYQPSFSLSAMWEHSGLSPLALQLQTQRYVKRKKIGPVKHTSGEDKRREVLFSDSVGTRMQMFTAVQIKPKLRSVTRRVGSSRRIRHRSGQWVYIEIRESTWLWKRNQMRIKM